MENSPLYEAGIISPTSVESKFKSYELDERTTELGYRLTAENRMVIQNLLCAYAHEHLNIHYNPDIPHEAGLIQARLYGMMESLQHLLDGDAALQRADEEARHIS